VRWTGGLPYVNDDGYRREDLGFDSDAALLHELVRCLGDVRVIQLRSTPDPMSGVRLRWKMRMKCRRRELAEMLDDAGIDARIVHVGEVRRSGTSRP
jgi:hypothetical protein